MTFFSAFILGLVASVHCAGMCGGLQIALQSSSGEIVMRSKQQSFYHLLLLNVGRVVTYVCAGVIFTSLGYLLLAPLELPALGSWLRRITGVLILLIGLQILLKNSRPFRFLEPVGATLWNRAKNYINLGSPKPSRTLINGLIWGLLPCGLIYSLLLTTAFAADVEASALTMLGFGLGTWPSLLLTGLLYRQFRELLTSSAVQLTGGIFFVLGGILILTAPYWISTEFINQYPVLLNSVFCLTDYP
jgi:sulfite exporter TauE/SafE